jgi:O-glycosyl hydrolase
MSTPLFVRLCLIVVALCASALRAAPGLGLPDALLAEGTPPAEAFPLVAPGAPATLWINSTDFAGVQRAAADLQADIARVTALSPALSTAAIASPPSVRPVIIGTLGKSSVINALVASGKLNVSDLTGKWESFVITTVAQPLPGVDQALVIVGSDKRGTIYGIYELSEQLGVSPWYWWADVPPKTRATAYILPGRFASGEPVVKYRGIFLNDEAPALTGWANAKFGGLNQQFYSKVFELLLRLRGNYLWPAMWSNAFNEDDSGNPALADSYGIVMGTSHHEPMLRSQQEWSRHKTSYGNATWDYQTNAAGLQAFWTDGITRNKNFESVVTVGMRGDGDSPMISGGTMAANISLLTQIINDQRTILTTQTGLAASQTPQIWALYKEVLDYYNAGMRVADDVTLLWPDDNWGNLRRLPTADERTRSGGAGVYYHFDYVGGPRSYKWMNTNPVTKIQEQMNLAWQYGATRMWIVNVGDLKPMEVPMEFFLRMAWDPSRWTADKVGDYLVAWATREFGAAYAQEAASLVAAYTKFNGRRKPELLGPDTFSLLNYREAERVRQDWNSLVTRANALYATLPAASKDAFYQLVLFPIKACANVNDLYITAAKNNLYATQLRASTNTLGTQAQALFQADADLVTHWNATFANGKWEHLMDQVHIGYTTWSDPAQNNLPTLQQYPAPATSGLGVAIEGTSTVLSSGGIGVLPALNSEQGSASRYIDVFCLGTLSTVYSITANQPWVNITNASGTLGADTRCEVSVDWSRMPTGRGEVLLTVQGASAATARTVRLPLVKGDSASPTAPIGFLDPDGYIAIEAPHYDRKVETGGVSWMVAPDLGRTSDGIMPVPVTAASVTPGGSTSRLEYDLYLSRTGEISARIIASPSLDFVPGRGLRCAISLDNQTPQIIDISTTVEGTDWSTAVKDSVRAAPVQLISDALGAHVLKIWMVDPGVVLQRIEIDTGGLKPSYLGPPESPRGRRASAVAGGSSGASSSVTIEAESGTVGSEFTTTTGVVPAYIAIITDNSGTSPASSARVASYQVTFPAAGTYRLFARVRVGPGGANDDSIYIGNGFGTKSPTTASNWKSINGLGGIGFTSLSDIVTPNSDNGTAGTGVWKWVDLTTLTSTSFTVTAGALTQTFQIGARENGLDIDKFVFGPTANTFTVDDLTQGTVGTAPGPKPITLEAESSAFGSEFTSTAGTPAYLSISTNSTGSSPGSALRVARFQAIFPAAGSYRLLARVRVGAGGPNDDSLFLGASFGAKSPTLASDWKTINNFSGLGFANSSDTVATTLDGTAGTGVWKWLDLTKLSGLGSFTVDASALTQTLDIGGREDGLDIDKLVFAPAANVYTVADLDGGAVGTAPSTSPIFTAQISDLRQTIDGFGASSAWNSTTLTDAQADQFFSPDTGLGLSLLRIRIAPEGTTVETGTAQKAVARGVQVWATPWSPPAAWKSNNDVNNGGTLLPAFQASWAARLADFVVNMQTAGVPLKAISAQNEPNFTATWESCVWTPAELTTFIRDQLGPALVSRGVSTRVLAPETIGWTNFTSYADAILGDTTAKSYVSHIATHNYNGSPIAYPAASTAGKALWQTEVSDGAATSDPTIDSGLRVANLIHDFLATSQGNAWHYWWLLQDAATASTGSLTENGVLAKRAWTLANWARFVRPGQRRVQAYGSSDTVRVTAFVASTTRRFTVVAINADTVARLVPLAIADGTVPSLTPWETSASRSLEPLSALTSAADGSFSLSLPARSVTTFVSEALNRAPQSLTLSNLTVSENQPAGTMVGTLSAADPDVGETFTYALVSGTGDTDNAAFAISGNQLRTATVFDFEAASARTCRIRVTDSVGISIEQAFTIGVVNSTNEYADWSASLALSQRAADTVLVGSAVPNLLVYAFGYAAGQNVPPASLPALVSSGGGLAFTFTLPANPPPDVFYEIESSTNLSSWTVVASKQGASAWVTTATIASATPVSGFTTNTLTVTAPASRVFYRLRTTLLPPQ